MSIWDKLESQITLAKTVKDLEKELSDMDSRVRHLSGDVRELRENFAAFRGEVTGTMNGFMKGLQLLPKSEDST